MTQELATVFIGAAVVVILFRMASAKKWGPALVGIIGFFGGTYSERLKLFKDFQISAATTIHRPVMGDIIPYSDQSSANRTAQIMRFGFPSAENIRSRKNYVLSYDPRNRVANWVIEHLTKDGVAYNDNVNRAKSEFFEDESIHPFFRSRNTDYRSSGYDRGHLAAAGNHRSSQELVDDTFVLSNMAPQVGKGFNRDSWNRLETHVRSMTKKYQNVYVCTGPLYLPKFEQNGKKYVKYEVVGNNNVAVPTHFFKVIVGETNDFHLDLEAYIMPNAAINDNVPLTTFFAPRETVEKAAGFLFFDKLPGSTFRSINGVRTRG